MSNETMTDDETPQSTLRIGGLILAGGAGTRMGGQDKPLVALSGVRLIDLVMARLAPQSDRFAISANRSLDVYGGLGVPVLEDGLDGFQGPLAGIRAGLIWAEEQGLTHLVSVAGDTPFFPFSLVRALEQGLEEGEGAIAMAANEAGDLQPVFALWPVALRGALDAALSAGTRKILDFAQPHGIVTVPFSGARLDPFFNVNSSADLARAEDVLMGGFAELPDEQEAAG